MTLEGTDRREEFSSGSPGSDKETAVAWGHAYGLNFRSYLGTPHGFIGVYNPFTDRTIYARAFGDTGAGWHP